MSKDLSDVHTYTNKLKRKNTQNGQIIHLKFFVLNEERIASILHKSSLSKFLSVKRDVNCATQKSVGRTFLIFDTRYDKFGRKR